MFGRKIARFRLVEELGRGGMGSVWKARDELLGRMVAVKVLADALAGDEAARRGFRRTAEIAARLDHPAIVPVYEAGEFEDLSFLVMKLVDGETLERFMRRRLPPPMDLLRVARTVAEALAYAHGEGVIHRDITPRNIMVTPAGACVLDFGLARVADATASSTGHVAGTPAYLAPERLAGRAAEARSDLYALGVVMYEALTGTRPFHGETTEALYYNIVAGAVARPRHLRPELDLATEALILSLLSRDPEGRPAAAQDVVAELIGILALPARVMPAPAAIPLAADAAAGEGPDTHAVGLADRLASGRTRTYLLVLPIDALENEPAHARVLHGLGDAIRAGLADLGHLHVVPGGADVKSGDLRTRARRAGANLVLRSAARFAGTVVRVSFTLVDPETGAEMAGGRVDGSSLEAFQLEDRWVAAVREALALPAESSSRHPARPRDPVANERLSLARSYLNRFDNEASIDGAISILETLRENEEESAAVNAALTRAYVYKYQLTRQRQWEARAAQACERATRLAPAAVEVQLAEGELHTVAGRYREALTRLNEAITTDAGCYELHVARARALDGLGHYPEAEAACRRALSLRPDDWRGHHILGKILCRRGDFAEAMAPWRRVTELTPDNAIGHLNLGVALFNIDRFDDALIALRRASEIRPHGMAYDNLGTALFHLGRYEESIEAFEKAVALSPADPWTWGNLGNACRRVPGRAARMNEALERAVALTKERFDREPGEGQDWSRLAGWLANLGRTEDAEQALQRALERSPDDVTCMVAAGLTLMRLGRRDEAIEWVRRAVERGYSLEFLRRSPDLHELLEEEAVRRLLEGGSMESSPGKTRDSSNGRPR
jgi:tetratricopeptide (TPR) repeat protein